MGHAVSVACSSPAICIKRTKSLAAFPPFVNHNADMIGKTMHTASPDLRRTVHKGPQSGTEFPVSQVVWMSDFNTSG